jgi:hypothetical protein
MRKFIVAACMVFLLGSVAAFAMDNPPPSGAILDLNGLAIPHGTAQEYTIDFNAAITSTDITFAFREDPAFFSFSDASVVDLANPTVNLLLNGNFSSGSGNNATDWTFVNIYGAGASGVVSSSCGGGLSTCWYDGAVGAYDAIDQTIATNVGDNYQISFLLTDNSGQSTFSAQDNNDLQGIDVLAYAQAGLPPAGETPEPSSIVLFSTGLVALVGAARRKMARN